MDELNVAAEKEAELTNKNKQLEEELRKNKTLVQEQQAQAILAQKQIALLDEAIKGTIFFSYLLFKKPSLPPIPPFPLDAREIERVMNMKMEVRKE